MVVILNNFVIQTLSYLQFKITNYIRSNLIKHVVDGTDNHLNVPTLYKLSRRDHLFQPPRRLHTNYQICVHNDGE